MKATSRPFIHPIPYPHLLLVWATHILSGAISRSAAPQLIVLPNAPACAALTSATKSKPDSLGGQKKRASSRRTHQFSTRGRPPLRRGPPPPGDQFLPVATPLLPRAGTGRGKPK